MRGHCFFASLFLLFLSPGLVQAQGKKPVKPAARPAVAATGAGAHTIPINPTSPGRRFEGVYAISGGGATSRLLINYPEPQRSQILDYLFKPGFGASLHGLKVEIGGDGNSTQGAEPSHIHYPEDEDYQRGVQWFMLAEAKKRNPAIKTAALAWTYPWYLRRAGSEATANYLTRFVKGVYAKGISLDYIGLQNETKVPYSFIATLHNSLRKGSMGHTRIIADDSNLGWTVADSLSARLDLDSLVYGYGVHYPNFKSSQRAQASGKPLLASEDGTWNDDWARDGQFGRSLAKTLNRNYIEGRITGTHIWCLASAYYDILNLPNAGMIRCAQPWSGHYQLRPNLWEVAHTTQFTQVGWRYLDPGCGYLPGRSGSYVTYSNGSQFTTVIETIEASRPQTVTLQLDKPWSAATVYVWESNARQQLQRLAPVKASGGKLTVQVQPGSLYTLTSWNTGSHGVHAAPPAPRPFPIPYTENFDSYGKKETNYPYLMVQNGSYEVANHPDLAPGRVLKQAVPFKPINWSYGDTLNRMGTPVVFGDSSYANYRVSVEGRLDKPGYLRVMGRVLACTQFGNIDGYQFIVEHTGQFRIIKSNLDTAALARGKVNFKIGSWHKLALECRGNEITALFDGEAVAKVTDGYLHKGLAGFGSGWHFAFYDNLRLDPLPGTPLRAARQNYSQITTAPVVTVTKAGSDGARLTWGAVPGRRQYAVAYGLAGQPLRHGGTLFPNASYEAHGLTPGMKYRFKVRAEDLHGPGPWSEEVEIEVGQ